MSAAGIMKAAGAIGCRAEWLRSGIGDMADTGAGSETLRDSKVSGDVTSRQKPKPLPTSKADIIERTKSFGSKLTKAAEQDLVTPQLMQALEGMLEAGLASSNAAAFAKRSRAAIRAAVQPEGQTDNEGQKRGSAR